MRPDGPSESRGQRIAIIEALGLGDRQSGSHSVDKIEMNK
jgi:hypothetical protein